MTARTIRGTTRNVLGSPACVRTSWRPAPPGRRIFLMQHVLLQTPTSKDLNWTPIIIGCLILIVVVVLGLLVVSWMKRRMQAGGEPVPAGFTLSDLRRLHKAGQITDEEFERAKARTIERYKAKEKKAREGAEAAGLGGAANFKGLGGMAARPELPGED